MKEQDRKAQAERERQIPTRRKRERKIERKRETERYKQKQRERKRVTEREREREKSQVRKRYCLIAQEKERAEQQDYCRVASAMESSDGFCPADSSSNPNVFKVLCLVTKYKIKFGIGLVLHTCFPN